MGDVDELRPVDASECDGATRARVLAQARNAHVALADRIARGKAMRDVAPRSAHAVWEPPTERRDPVELLEDQARTRVPELVPIRYGRMLISPFTFYRGAALVMASDLAGTPRTGLDAQLCGDAHLSNFGTFAAPDRRLVFSINDFDETLPGPFEWDLKRLVTSFTVAGRDRGFGRRTREKINRTVTRSYSRAMREFATMGNLAQWYARIELDGSDREFRAQATPKQIRTYDKNVAKARSKDSLRAFAKLTQMVNGEPRIISDPPVITPIEDIADAGKDIGAYLKGVTRFYARTMQGDRRKLLERYRYVHGARKVVGVGSVGTRAWIVLLLGRDGDDPLFLQAKEAEASVLEPFVGASKYTNHGQRVVEGQRLTQSASDVMLGWLRADALDTPGMKRDFYVRQLWDTKGSALIELMAPNVMESYARVCGAELARAHARSGDSVAIAAYLGSNDALARALSAFAESYADQNERDYAALQQAVESGRVTALAGL